MGHISRRRFLAGAAAAGAGPALLGRAPAARGQQIRELQVWHTEVEPQTVKTIQGSRSGASPILMSGCASGSVHGPPVS